LSLQYIKQTIKYKLPIAFQIQYQKLLINHNMKNSIRSNLLISMVLVCFIGCKSDKKPYENSKTSSRFSIKDVILTASDSITLNGANAMAFSLFKSLSKPNENLFFSSYSVASSFALIYPGSKGETKDEIQRFFQFNTDPEANSKLFCTLNNVISQLPDKAGEVNVANALWVQDGYKIEPLFEQQSKKYFNSELYSQDFINKPGRSCNAINEWVYEKTNHKIANIISESDITNLTCLILTNSIYFNRKWYDEFDKTATQNAVFYNSDKTESTVKMMNKSTEFKYGEDSLLQILEIPYVGDYSMLVLLPKSGQNGFHDVDFNYQNYLKWTSLMTPLEVILSMPKFKLEDRLQFSDVLSANGLSTAFTKRANFRGIFNFDSYIDKFYQYSYISVDEEKTEAAATGVMVASQLSAYSESPPKVFNMNHPFVFLIVCHRFENILFLGKINKLENEN